MDLLATLVGRERLQVLGSLVFCLVAFCLMAGSPEIVDYRKDGDRFEIVASREADRSYDLEASTDLQSWGLLQSRYPSAEGAQSSMAFADLQAGNLKQRFYRVAAGSDPKSERPNILFIMTDDQAPWAVKAAGHPHAVTPNMDRIYREGAVLPNMFTPTPVCSPSRASLMTSRYGTELGITDWIHPGREPDLGLPPEMTVWPEVLANAGYVNGLVGKWHLGTRDRFHPTTMGYDYFMGFRGGGNSPEDPSLEKNGQRRQFDGFTPDILTDHAMEFIREHQKAPWMLSLHYRAPHTPWLPVHDEDWELFKDLDPTIPNPHYPKLDIDRVKRMTREYLASIKSVDRNLGRLLAFLEELELSKETVIIFTSDHGYNMGHNGIWHKGNGHWVLTEPPPATPNIPRWQRPNMYDRSIGVPAAVRWPGKIDPDTVVNETLTFLDWYPTLLAFAGAEVPSDTKIRGRNFLPLLLGEDLQWDNELFGQYSTHHQSRTHMRMWRTREWKLVRDFKNPERDELYHLASDPAERTNLIDSDRTDVKKAIERLHRKIVQRMRDIDDPALEAMKRAYGPPSLLEVDGHVSRRQAILQFSKPVSASTAEALEHYTIEGLPINRAELRPDGETVALHTESQTAGVTYNVRVSGIEDREGRRMEGSEADSFTAWEIVDGELRMEVYRGIGGTSLNSLTAHESFPEAPDRVATVSEVEVPTNVADRYGARLTGWITPEETGDYVFYISSDDDGALLLSPNENRSELEEIARDPHWHRPRDWMNPERRRAVSGHLENQSRPIHLEAGQEYAIEARMKDGGGGDNMAVTWRRSNEPAPSKGDSPIAGRFLSTIAEGR